MRLPGPARIGILFVSLGILVFVPVYYWVNSRTLVPLDVPVSLSPGHIRTGNFKINVEAYFSAQVRFPCTAGSECRDAISLRTRQLPSIGSQAISIPGAQSQANNGITHGTYLGSFRGKPGHYNVDIEVLSATREFDHCQPRLVIEASSYDFDEWDSILSVCYSFCLFCELLGISILFVFATTRLRKESLEELRLRIFNTDAPSGPVPPLSFERESSIPLLLILGVFAVVLGAVVFVATKHWYDTRNFVLVNTPVSLRKGHIKTGNFTTNLKGTYSISFDMQVPSIAWCPQYAALKTHWVVTRNGRVIAHRERGEYPWEKADAPIEGTELSSFDAEPGTYDLDVEVLSDGSCLNIDNPRLRVYLADFDRFEYDALDAKLLLVSVLSIGMGLAFLLSHRFARLRQKSRALPLAIFSPERMPTWGITGLRYRRSPRHHAWAMNPVMNIPTITLVCSLVWFTWLMPMWIVSAGEYRNSYGLLVSLPWKEAPTTATMAPGLTAPLVRMDAKRHLYLNYKRTTWEELPAGLEQALRGLPVRVAYFDGDADVQFGDAAWTIDIIEGLGAKVILMTPGAKAKD